MVKTMEFQIENLKHVFFFFFGVSILSLNKDSSNISVPSGSRPVTLKSSEEFDRIQSQVSTPEILIQ